MTTKSEAELAIQGARAVFDALCRARIAEQHVRLFHRRHKNKPEYQQWMRDMGLSEWLEEFVNRPTLKRG